MSSVLSAFPRIFSPVCLELGSGIVYGWSAQGRGTGTRGAGSWVQRETPAFITAAMVTVRPP